MFAAINFTLKEFMHKIKYKKNLNFISSLNYNKRMNSSNFFFQQIKYYSKLLLIIYYIKKFFFVINCFILIYIEAYISQLKKYKGRIKDIENINNTNELEIDNEIRFISYEENVDFSKYSTNVKIIALYLPNFNSLNFLKNCIPKYKGHHQPRIQDKRYINNYNLENYYLVKKQIQLAKSHGIYGFGIYFYWFSGKTIFDKPLNFIYKSNIKFNFLLIWKNEVIKNEKNEVLLKVKYEENDPENFILYIKKYLLDHRYIRIEGKPIIGLYSPKNIPKLKETITIWRKKAIECGIGKIIIISALNDINISELIDRKLFDAAYKIYTNNLFFNYICKNTRYNFSYYYGIFYTNIISNENIENFPVYKSIMVEYDNSPITQEPKIFGDYSPELFYILNKYLIHQISNNNNQLNNFLFINAWNNYYEGTYLEPDSKYGYSSLNALSKALFNLPFKTINNNLSYLITNCSVAIQVHVFYDDLIEEIINKTNNILVKFDLYITTDNNKKMEFISQYKLKHPHTPPLKIFHFLFNSPLKI
jgi:hypothetical protein